MEGWEELQFLDWEGQFSWGGAEQKPVIYALQQQSWCFEPCKASTCNVRDWVIPGLGRSSGERRGYPLQYSGLENSMDCTVHVVAKSRTWLRDFHFTSLLWFQSIKNLVGRRKCYWSVLLRNHQHTAFVPMSDTDECQLTLDWIKSSVHELEVGTRLSESNRSFYGTPTKRYDVLVSP